jgi:hypothetical protein
MDQIEDDELRTFINEILRFERSKLDRENYHYSDEYENLIEKHVVNGKDGESTDE